MSTSTSVQETVWLDRLQNRLGDAQSIDRGLDTDEVYESIMERLGYDDARKKHVYESDDEPFITLIDDHGYGVISGLLNEAIATLSQAPTKAE